MVLTKIDHTFIHFWLMDMRFKVGPYSVVANVLTQNFVCTGQD